MSKPDDFDYPMSQTFRKALPRTTPTTQQLTASGYHGIQNGEKDHTIHVLREEVGRMRMTRRANLPTQLKRGCSQHELIEWIRVQTDTVLLAFSRGKDSLATWLVLREAGFRVVPFHMEIVPGLRFVEESLQDYEQRFGVRIARVLHPCFFHWLRTLVAQPPWTADVIAACQLPRFEMVAVQRGVARTAGLPEDTWCAVGIRAVDSPTRRRCLTEHPPINMRTRSFYPIWQARQADIIQTVTRAGMPLAVDYAIWGRSFDGIDYRYIEPLRRQYPDDYAVVLDWFPMIDMAFMRKEVADRYASHATA